MAITNVETIRTNTNISTEYVTKEELFNYTYTSDGVNYGIPFNQIGENNVTIGTTENEVTTPANLPIAAGQVLTFTSLDNGYIMKGYVISYDFETGYLVYSIVTNFGTTDDTNQLNYTIQGS